MDQIASSADPVSGRNSVKFPAADGFVPSSSSDRTARDEDPSQSEESREVVRTRSTAGVSAEAAEALIEHKRIGERIKALRQRKRMGLVELGRYTGLSASFLSQLETGRVVPTLRNLTRIAMVFSKDLSYFFEPERPELFRIVRASERQRLPQTGANQPDYFFENLGHVPVDQMVAPYVADFLPAGDRHPPSAHQHTGAEFLYMLSGRLRLTHEGRGETLERGDAVYFDSSAKHSYERLGEERCTALILTMTEPLRRPVRSAMIEQGNENGAMKRRV